MSNSIYLDNAATTPVLQCARYTYIKYMDNFYNPSASYTGARKVREDVEKARATIAELVGADPEEIYFTSGATEGNNTVIKGCLNQTGGRLVTSNIEHHSVLNLVDNSSYVIKADLLGHIDPYDFDDAIDDTDIVSIMMVNNEIGTVQPIKKVVEVAKIHNAYVHTDMTQAVGHIPVDCHDLGIDFATASGHKFGAPKGIGFMYIRKGVHIPSLLIGGGQERGQRSGTENVAGIMAMAEALKYNSNKIVDNNQHLRLLQSYLLSKLREEKFDFFMNSTTMPKDYAGIFNICMRGLRSEEIVEFMSTLGIYISAGSACNADNGEPSHVLRAIGLTDDEAECSIRISMSLATKKDEIDSFVNALKTFVDIKAAV